jgi:hypothetical protein
MNACGELLGELRWKRCQRFSSGRALVQCAKTDLCGYVDEQGQVVIEPQYVDAENFNDGYAVVVPDHSGKKAIIDMEGQVIIPPKWHNLSSYGRDHFCVIDDSGAIGLIDLDGEIVVPPRQFRCDYDDGDWHIPHQIHDELKVLLFETLRQRLLDVRSKATTSLASYIDWFNKGADERDLATAGLWLQKVELITGFGGVAAGTRGQIAYYYPVNANCFDLKVEVPVIGLYADNDERTLGVPWETLRFVNP